MTVATDSNSSLASLNSEQPSLKSHRTPHRREIVIQIFAPDKKGNLGDNTVYASPTTLPPTPPDTTPEKDNRPSRQWEKHNGGPYRFGNSLPTIRITAPSKRSDPPTPEETPPRRASTCRRVSNKPRQVSHSSRAETLQSDRGIVSDNVSGSHLSVKPSRQNTNSQTPPKQDESIGKKIKFGSNQSSNVSDTSLFVDQTRETRPYESISNHAVKRERRIHHRNAKDTEALATLAMHIGDRQSSEASLTRESSLRDRVKDNHDPISTTSLEQFRKEIGWPSNTEYRNTAERPDSQRLSGVSTTSTVEAMIVNDSARQTRPTLRHTEKRSSLRSASSPMTRLERASMSSNSDLQHRLVHKAARITEQDRKSIASEISTSTGLTPNQPHERFDVVPVVVIPERRSSLNPSAPSSTNPSNVSSQRSTQRAATAPRGRASSGPPHAEKQTASDRVPVFLQDIDSRGRSVRRPIIPSRRSSLSAPTSVNTSRATSLTTESLHSHTLAMEKVQTKKDQAERPAEAPRGNSHLVTPNTPDGVRSQSILIGVEDMDHLRTPSVPFSLGSMPSSPGTFELSEATAVAFFPHNNESLLLIDQQMRKEKQDAEARHVSSNESGNSQAGKHQNHPLGDGNTAQRDPRPPKPPVCKVIPPTPMNELERDSSRNGRQKTLRSLGSLRRAWSLRSRSESMSTLKRSFSTPTKNRKAGESAGVDNRLHPFWRPRRLWNEPLRSSATLPPHNPNESGEIVKNSLGMPQPRVVLNGPSLPTRRRVHPEPSTTRNMPYNLALNLSTIALANTSRVFSPDLLDRTSRQPGFCPPPITCFGSFKNNSNNSRSSSQARMSTMRMRNLRKRLRRRMQQREEFKLEARREKLKRSIGGVVRVESGPANGVLPRGL